MLDDRAIKALLLRTAAHDDGSAEAFHRLYELSASKCRSHRGRVRGQLAVSVEPAGGAPGGKPTGPVILVGPIKA